MQKKSTKKSSFPKDKLQAASESITIAPKASEDKFEKKRMAKGQNKENIKLTRFDKENNKENVKPLTALSL